MSCYEQWRRAPQLLEEALCTAPATRKAARKLSVLRLLREASRGPAAPTEALCIAPATRKAARKLSVLRLPREASHGPAAPAPQLLQEALYGACHAKGSQEALCTTE